MFHGAAMTSRTRSLRQNIHSLRNIESKPENREVLDIADDLLDMIENMQTQINQVKQGQQADSPFTRNKL